MKKIKMKMKTNSVKEKEKYFENLYGKKFSENNLIFYGNGNQINLLKGFNKYCGYDISFKAIEMCKNKFSNNQIFYFTNNMNYFNYDADLLLLIDMWYHQTDDIVFEELCHTVFETGNWKYI